MAIVLEWIKALHSPETFALWLSQGGIFIVAGIIFAETGLLLGFFLPGDSLLITAGVFSNPLNPNHVDGITLASLMGVLTLVAIIGDQVGYFLGRKTGEMIYTKPDGLFFKKKYVLQARAFYEQYGIAAIIACRFIPILRTFVPFIAGVAKMEYRRFLKWDIVGGAVWINSLLLIGYFLGQTEFANRLDKVILLVIFVSILPMVVGALKKTLEGKKHVSS
ncbi:MAG: VTT domain-containing protein [Bdellovibrionales bacterium]|nr:VTT domain-containing protein [Oligoflexia bacterium]